MNDTLIAILASLGYMLVAVWLPLIRRMIFGKVPRAKAEEIMLTSWFWPAVILLPVFTGSYHGVRYLIGRYVAVLSVEEEKES